MAVKTLLNYAEKEIRKLKKSNDNSNRTRLDIIICFDRSEDDMKRLYGYADFAKALSKLGNEHTEDTIIEACKISHFSRGSVFFDDMHSESENIRIPVTCTAKQAQRVLYHSTENDRIQMFLD